MALPESAAVVNIMLHAIYDMPYNEQQSDLTTVTAALASMRRYQSPLETYIACGTSLYNFISGQAPLKPLEAYTVATENQIEPLAVAISPYIMPFTPHDIPDDFALRIGPLYLKRVWALRRLRCEKMSSMIRNSPTAHSPTSRCEPASRQGSGRAWSLAGAQLAEEFKP
ncbi:hypothetical protein EIP86_000986, partial [Pleurotus ostreatoroseus]